jgi:hypothetical protein
MRYHVQLYVAEPGTHTRWKRATNIFFESDLSEDDLDSELYEFVDAVVAEPETAGQDGTGPSPDPVTISPDGPAAPLKCCGGPN